MRPSTKRHDLHEFAWWYEDERGITVVQESRKPDGTHLATEAVDIPWGRIMAAAKRCGRVNPEKAGSGRKGERD